MRLADRRGLLTGDNLSPVQSLGLEMLMLIEVRERQMQFADELRLGLLGAFPTMVGDLYPELVNGSDTKTSEPATPGTPESIEEQKQISWSVPSSEAEADAIDAWVNAHLHGQTATGNDLTEWR